MSKRSLSQLRSWFETGDTPTQQQFYDWLDSFHHKDAGHIVKSVETLPGGKKRLTLTDGQAFEVVEEFSELKWVVIGDVLTKKKEGNVDYQAIQVGDMIQYYPTEDRFIHARVNALPYTDDNNLTFFQDQAAL